jgi:hypothetical protein
VTASANIQNMIASINNSSSSTSLPSLQQPSTTVQLNGTPTLKPTNSTSTTPCTPPVTNITTISLNTLNDLKSKFESTANKANSNQRPIQSNFSSMCLNDAASNSNGTPTMTNSSANTPSSTALSSASTVTLCSSNSTVISRSTYFNANRDQNKQNNTPNSIFRLNSE